MYEYAEANSVLVLNGESVVEQEERLGMAERFNYKVDNVVELITAKELLLQKLIEKVEQLEAEGGGRMKLRKPSASLIPNSSVREPSLFAFALSSPSFFALSSSYASLSRWESLHTCCFVAFTRPSQVSGPISPNFEREPKDARDEF